LSAQGSQAMIKGQISDDSGATVPGIIAMLEGTSKGGVSNLDGRYEIKNIKPGTYQLVISGIGFVKQKKQITLETGQTVNIDISLVEDTKELNEVVVRGKSEATRVREQSYAVSSIDARPLQNLNLDLNKVLSKVSGVRIRETGGLGSHFSFSLNGFNGNQVRFFLDGVPMENFGSSLSLNNLPINIADRIEIYKGVVPVRLGSDALGGAVNIVTNQNIGTYLDASYTYGSFNTHRTSINGGYTNSENGFTVRANLFQNYSDNSYKVLVNKKEGSVLLKELEEVERFHDGYDSKSAIVDIGLVNRPFADQLLVGVILSKSEKEQQTGATMEKVYGQRKQISSTLMPTVRYKKKDLLVDGLELNGFASYNFGYTQTVDTTSRTYFWDGTYVEKADPTSGELNKTRYKFTDNSFITRGNLSYLLNENHSFVANYTFNSVDRQGNDTANPLEISNREPKLVSKSVIGVGYKFDWDETVTVSLFAKNYRLGGETYYTENIYDDPARVKRNLKQSQLGYGTAFSYRVPDTDLQIKGSIENAYRMPEALELFGDGANVRGNVKLKPEQSMNYNIGAMYELNPT
jgi:outer membrane cobalamin receptor